MGSTGAIVFLAAFVAIGLSIYGLFNRGRSIWCIVAGIVVVFGALPGALHAWGEGRSIPWTAVYVIIALIGIASIFRQARPRKQEQENAEHTN